MGLMGRCQGRDSMELPTTGFGLLGMFLAESISAPAQPLGQSQQRPPRQTCSIAKRGGLPAFSSAGASGPRSRSCQGCEEVLQANEVGRLARQGGGAANSGSTCHLVPQGLICCVRAAHMLNIARSLLSSIESGRGRRVPSAHVERRPGLSRSPLLHFGCFLGLPRGAGTLCPPGSEADYTWRAWREGLAEETAGRPGSCLETTEQPMTVLA